MLFDAMSAEKGPVRATRIDQSEILAGSFDARVLPGNLGVFKHNIVLVDRAAYPSFVASQLKLVRAAVPGIRYDELCRHILVFESVTTHILGRFRRLRPADPLTHRSALSPDLDAYA